MRDAERERDAIETLRRLYERDNEGTEIYDMDDFVDAQIGPFIRKYGSFADQKRDARRKVRTRARL